MLNRKKPQSSLNNNNNNNVQDLENRGNTNRNSNNKKPKICTTSTFCLMAIALILCLANSLTKSKESPIFKVVSNTAEATNNLNTKEKSNDKGKRKLSPFYSTKPLDYSLHPKYKLWIEMTKEEQDKAMEFVGGYMKKYADIIKPPGKGLNQLRSVKHGDCLFDEGIGSTGHTICGPKPPTPCYFISFGINDDPSWDREVANQWGCRGFAGDPTVHHPSKIHENVTFHNIGATMLQDNEERLVNKGGAEEWWYTSFPKLRYFLGIEKINVLKIDCEGCEVAMPRDILREDPEFLFKVDQLSIETHVTKTWMTTREHVYYFGLMFVLLEEAGFKMEWSSVFGCSKRHEIAGCMPDLLKYGWPCGHDPWPGHPNVVLGFSCQEFTWKRYD